MSFFKQPLVPGDVIIEKIQSIDTTVTVSGEEGYFVGMPLVSVDGGASFTKAIDGDNVVVNGVLGENLPQTGTASVLLMGTAKEHEAMTAALTDRMRLSAFSNHIIFA